MTGQEKRIAKIGELIRRGEECWGNKSHNFYRWLKDSSIQALGGKAPVEMFGTIEGIQECINIIGRIEHGVYS